MTINSPLKFFSSKFPSIIKPQNTWKWKSGRHEFPFNNNFDFKVCSYVAIRIENGSKVLTQMTCWLTYIDLLTRMRPGLLIFSTSHLPHNRLFPKVQSFPIVQVSYMPTWLPCLLSLPFADLVNLCIHPCLFSLLYLCT